MDKINPKLRLDYPYSITGKVRRFPSSHYWNTSTMTRTCFLVSVPCLLYFYSKITKALQGPMPKKMKEKRLAVFEKHRPFKSITPEMVE